VKSRLDWLYPGLGVKRWVLLALAGGLTLAFSLLLGVSAVISYDRVAAIGLGSLRGHTFVTGVLVGGAFIFGCVGLYFGIRGLLRFQQPSSATVGEIRRSATLARGPRVTAIGGGNGLAALLRGFKGYTSNLTAVVTVADDGGSSGKLRQDMGMLPPGDIRNCLVALADDDELMSRLFQYRFADGGLAGHSFGNLFVAALAEVTGDFERAVQESTSVLKVRGRVLPSTLVDIVLHAQMQTGDRVSGESTITANEHLPLRVWITPKSPPAHPQALEAIARADLVVLGPGSVYTSIMPNLLVAEVCEALRDTRARVVYVCNVMTQPGETDGYTAADHVEALFRHGASGLIDDVIVNDAPVPDDVAAAYARAGARPVVVDDDRLAKLGVRVVHAPVAGGSNLFRHDSTRLARILVRMARR
jgi:uncharacterized cofD-like protein